MNTVRTSTSLILAALVACSGESPEMAASGPLTVTADTTESGVIYVRSGGDAPEWRLEEVLTLDQSSRSDDPLTTFVEATSVALDRTDAIWIADAGSRQIRVFNPEGSLIRLIGGPGDGPGEFGTLNSIAFVGRSVLALDSVNERIVAFSVGGGFRGTRPAPFEEGRGSTERRRLYQVGPSEVYEPVVRDGEEGVERVWVRHAEGDVAGSRPIVPEPSGAPPTVVTCEAPSEPAPMSFPLPFQARQVQHPASRGELAVAWTGEYRVVFLDAAGDTLRIVERARAPVTLTEDDRESVLAPYLAFRDRHPEAVCEPAELTMPEIAPPIRDLMVDAAGRLLVEAPTPDGMVWDVYDLAGHPLGTFPSFERTEGVAPYATTEGMVWVTEDSSGAQQVKLARIAR